MVFVYEVLNEDPPAHMGRLVAVVVWGGVLLWWWLWFGVVWFIVVWCGVVYCDGSYGVVMVWWCNVVW